MSQPITATTAQAVPDSPPARRLDRRRWRDARLWVGVLLVAGSVLAGARLVTSSDDSVEVWAVADDVPAGRPLDPSVLTRAQVRFADPATGAGYLLADEAVAPDAVARRALGAGELVPRTAVTSEGADDLAHLPVVVDAAGAPADLRAGDVVDVWVVPPQSTDGDTGPASKVLDGVPVASSARDTGPLGEAATRQVLLGVDERGSDGLGLLLTSVTTGTVVLIRSDR